MKILRIVYDWPDKNNITEGLAPAPYELSLAQTRQGHEIFVLCGNLNGRNLKKLKFSYTLPNGKIHVYNLPRALKGFGPFLTTSLFISPYYFYLKFIKRIELVHNHGHLGVWFLWYKFLFGFLDRTPVVGHYHITARGREDALHKNNQPIPFLSRCFEYPIHKFSDFLMAKVCSHLVAVSNDLVEEIKRFYHIPDNKITLLESAVDSERFKKEGEAFSLDFETNDVIVGNGGRLSKRKNIDVLVKSLNYLPENYKLVLWGTWDEAFKHEVDAIIKGNKLENRIRYLGNINYFEVDKYYRAVEIFALPSSYEGLPKVVLEALASGCKVLASGFSTQYPMQNLNFLSKIEERNLADELKSLVLQPNDYQNTREIIEKYYSWDSKAEILNKIYKKVKI